MILPEISICINSKNKRNGDFCAMIKALNPIIPGFAPDPSICRVGDDYYLVNSTFSYFPGLPIYHSRDLANWELIGSALDRTSQLPLDGAGHSRGLFAPTIRWHDGVFYLICTNIDHGGNFLVTATDPKGPWSEPYWLGDDASGIDPSLFFDDDGTCWYCGTRGRSEGEKYFGDNEIYLRQLDLNTMKLTGETYIIWHSALVDAHWPEGPHIYKRGDYYYVMIAEGGTGPNHAVTVARCETLTGKYVGHMNNPILTHRHLGKDYYISKVGHGDLVDAPDGSWYMVMLASRPQRGVCPLGRETFLAKVTWEEDWPVVNPGIGKLEDVIELPFEADAAENCVGLSFEFDGKTISNEFMSLREPIGERAAITEQGCLRLYGTAYSLSDSAPASYFSVRPRVLDFSCTAAFTCGGNAEECGIAVLQNETHHIRLVRKGGSIEAIICCGGKETTVGKAEIQGDECTVCINVANLYADFSCNGKAIAEHINVDYLSTEIADGFVGNTAGLYCRGGEDSYIDCSSFIVK